jgi:hypothetical protein
MRGCKVLPDWLLADEDWNGTDRVSGECRGDNQRGVSVAEDQYFGEGQCVGMRDGEERRSAAHRVEPAGGAAVQPQLRRTAAAHNLDVAPQHALRVAGSQRFHRRFFRREPAGEVDRRLTTPHTVGHLPLGEDTMGEALAVTRDSGEDTRDVRGVQTESDDVHASQA